MVYVMALDKLLVIELCIHPKANTFWWLKFHKTYSELLKIDIYFENRHQDVVTATQHMTQ
jgi:hypothetical protein